MNNSSKDNCKDNNKKNTSNSYDPNSMGYESAEVGHLLVDPANYDEINDKISKKFSKYCSCFFVGSTLISV